MSFRFLMALLVTVTGLSGCGNVTRQDLQKQAAYRISAALPINYQLAHKRLLTRMRDCMAQGTLGFGTNVEIQQSLYSELREANVSYVTGGITGNRVNMSVDIKALGDTTSRVSVLLYFKASKGFLDNIPMWIDQDEAPCEVPAGYKRPAEWE